MKSLPGNYNQYCTQFSNFFYGHVCHMAVLYQCNFIQIRSYYPYIFVNDFFNVTTILRDFVY